jgi:hypothetical protein
VTQPPLYQVKAEFFRMLDEGRSDRMLGEGRSDLADVPLPIPS